MTEPVSLSEAKVMLRMGADASPEDGLIGAFISAAREMVERFTGLVLTRREVVEAAPAFGPWIELRAWPIVSVESVEYLDSAGAVQDLAAGTWRANFDARPVRLLPMPSGWGVAACGTDAILPVTVTLTAGYAPENLPATIRQAILLLVGHFYEHRGGENAGKVDEVPPTVAGLLRSWRLWRV